MLTGLPRPAFTTLLFLTAIVLGSLVGSLAPAVGSELGSVVDPLILLLVGVLFFTLRLDGLSALRRSRLVVALAIGVNFVVIPLIAWPLSALLPSDALRLGVLIYFLAPCTDWFLGFTRMAGGDTTTGAALIPVQMTLQLLLYPVWLFLFAGQSAASSFGSAGPTLLTWFVAPAAIALTLRLVMRLTLSARVRAAVVSGVDRAVPFVIAAVIVGIFAGNIETILSDVGSFAWVLLVVFLFFVVTFFVGEAISKVARLRYREHALLTMTTSARNAPLMLAVTTVALPDQPIVAAAIVLGMLIEFPHLTVITHLLRGRAARVDQPPRPLETV
ncbi:bile acid:sodium symporter [Microbacterium sediminicola]|uniref:Bile acid:sodium symporter n=1 Tax=Microbacterium sediminicola TaxID=415210 RepID=A0ABP4TXM0_9MICO